MYAFFKVYGRYSTKYSVTVKRYDFRKENDITRSADDMVGVVK